MLTEMKAKGVKMKAVEKLTFDKYTEWADDMSKDLALEIKSSASKIESLLAFIAKADSDVNELGSEIKDLDSQISSWEGELKEASTDRTTQHEEYLKVSQDYSESVDALTRAIQVLSSQNYDREQADALLQQMASSGKGYAQSIAAFLQQQHQQAKSLRGDQAPAVAAYEFQSGGIIETLKDLLDKFRSELADVEKGEVNEAHAFDMAELHLKNVMSAASSQRDEKAILKGQKAQESAKAKGELATAKSDKAANEKLKAEIEATFKVKKSAYEENQQVRADELAALDKAIEILSSPEVQASYSKHVSLAQAQATPRGAKPVEVSFLQMTRRTRRVSHEATAEAYKLLNDKAKQLNSKALADLATEVAANPFAKVIGMIESLLEKLKEEAAAEADHKAWCDQELKANKEKRNEKTAEAERLMAEIDGKKATIAEMAASIQTLAKEQAELATAMSEATALRTKEKSENLEAIQDATQGAEAVKQALIILKEFYDSQAPAAALIQQKKQVPEMAAYKGMQGNTGGVIGMLEVIESDFTRLKTETQAEEMESAQQYDRFMKESTASKQQKHEAEFQLKLDEDQQQFEKERLEKDLASVEEELKKANLYYGELKPACVQVHVSYEERVKGRQEEIEALKQAYKVLDQHGKDEQIE